MLDMAKKKPTHGPAPVVKKPDAHKSNCLVRLHPALHAAMMSLAKESERALTREIKLALVAWLRGKGKAIPEGLE